MRFFVRNIAVIMFLAIGIMVGCSDNLKRYENLAMDFKLRYPPAWEAKENVGSSVVTFLSPKQNETDLFVDNVNISVDELMSAVPFERYTEQVLDQISQIGRLPNVKLDIKESAEVRISGRKGYRIVYTLTQFGYPQELIDKGLVPAIDAKGEAFQFLQVWTVIENRAYILTFLTTPQDYPALIGDVDLMLKTFRLL